MFLISQTDGDHFRCFRLIYVCARSEVPISVALGRLPTPGSPLYLLRICVRGNLSNNFNHAFVLELAPGPFFPVPISRRGRFLSLSSWSSPFGPMPAASLLRADRLSPPSESGSVTHDLLGSFSPLQPSNVPFCNSSKENLVLC